MIFRIIDNNNYLIKIYKEMLKNIDIYNIEDIKHLLTIIFTKLLKKYKLNGLIFIDIYINEIYGIIITIEEKKTLFNIDEINVKIGFNFNSIFLYKIDYFDLIYLNIKQQDIYYFNNSYYLNIINGIDNDKYLKLLEFSDIIYKDINNVINKGIKIIKL